MKRHTVVRASLIAIMLSTLLSAGVNVATNILPDRWSRYEWISLPLIGILVAIIGITEARRIQEGEHAVSSDTDLLRVRRALTQAVSSRLDKSSVLSALSPPGPMTVNWSIGRQELSAHPSVLLRTTDARLPKTGAFEDVLDLFRHIPTRQLVILGDPGAGKTALSVFLQREILRAQYEFEAVPLLVSLSDWDPEREPLTDWFARKALRDHPALGDYQKYGRRAVQRLVDDRVILPILDGLDEMPASHRVAALDALIRFAGDEHPFVLTCRTEQYAEALAKTGSVLPRAAVIEMTPVGTDSAITYLTHRAQPGSQRFARITDEIQSNTDSPIAQVLSTPLMIWLTAEVYRGVRDPSELADRERFATAEEISQHLLDGYLSGVYPDLPVDERRPGPRYTSDEARSWLRFLANHLARRDTRDIVWWQMSASLPMAVRIAVGALICLIVGGGLSGFVLGRHNPPVFVIALTISMSVPIAVALGYASSPVQPVRLGARADNSTKLIAQRALAGIGAGLLGGVFTVTTLGPVFALCLVGLGVALGILFALFGQPDLTKATSPRSLLHGDAIIFAILAGIGSTIGALGWVITNLTGGNISARLGATCIGALSGVFAGGYILRSPHEIRKSLLAVSRRSALGSLGGAALLGVIGYLVGGLSDRPMINESWTALGGSASFGLFFGLIGGFAETASSWFWVYNKWFWVRRKLPLDLLTFLEDAHRRGVLRQIGVAYQFRHATLQDRLIEPPTRVNDDGPASSSHHEDAKSPGGAFATDGLHSENANL